ncbi:MAG: hypothetical protein UV73_C0004G0133 [Candidatus Gottesmanbacteria bacterium GW2011_GWA2_43_14]|uniref:HMA domain-containing protein n=1 Tax=Candidatus Gottesmanbacteria bacterium GW2011_GWA2_43_14 TaxID=1618443 RepID=A0A0G1FSK3_9BACT|nr:MAG: hypothetical protein UV73_C0004G0133 [Candidatus Gottesmanbacteria bacterium GW2011_GWA2_43_14]
MSDINTLKFYVTGITCDACLKLIKRRVNSIEGVLDFNVSLTGEAQVTARRDINLTEIKKSLEGTDYQVIN